MIEEAIKTISAGNDLSKSQMYDVMQEIMTGKAATPEIVSFLTALDKKGESIEELTAAVTVMRRYVTKIDTKNRIILD
ncbi:MAG: anthranilate phosphoribosyltransferase, partial [Candidatus Omnitrophica bacterium]|nr:anthranilate phosphoribosyltransferase [Candidatus Omnitrophota bacterium]